MKSKIQKIVNFNSIQNVKAEGNLVLKSNYNSETEVIEYAKPKILTLKPKKSNKIFCGCWQVANQEDAC